MKSKDEMQSGEMNNREEVNMATEETENYDDVIEYVQDSDPEQPMHEAKAVPRYPQNVVRKTGRWGDKSVTRRFLSIALVGALILNVAITAGMMKLFGPKGGLDKESFGGYDRPGSEQQFGHNHGGKGQMMPPSGGQQGQQPGGQQGQQGPQQGDQPPAGSQQPGDQQDQQPNDQKPDDQQQGENSSDQDKT